MLNRVNQSRKHEEADAVHYFIGALVHTIRHVRYKR